MHTPQLSRFIHRYLSRQYLTRFFLCFVGVVIIGLGAGGLRYADFGLDPYMSFTNGVFLKIFNPLGISFGTAFLLLCIVVLFLVLVFDRSKIGPGTLINMVLVGYVSDFALFLLNKIPVDGMVFFAARIAAMTAGTGIICFGAGIYLNTNIGMSPYDASGLIIAEKTGRPGWYRWIRIGTDFVCTGLGFLTGSLPGAGTLIMAFFTGPLIAFFRFRILVAGKRAGIITWM